MRWYCHKKNSFIVKRKKIGLLIMGIKETEIFTVYAKSKSDAHEKAWRRINKTNT